MFHDYQREKHKNNNNKLFSTIYENMREGESNYMNIGHRLQTAYHTASWIILSQF